MESKGNEGGYRRAPMSYLQMAVGQWQVLAEPQEKRNGQALAKSIERSDLIVRPSRLVNQEATGRYKGSMIARKRRVRPGRGD
ncbi:hypothetical protein DM02DRAFT_654557 [Periconia macrospinosa]|uniref:Uncharacterized protein n=1 Tax=Periconia macrospinosa TaxID=97972 RepID=A0A2V1DVX4_9PLEO|nr:hypothetical protein DM02DRAFT_654557 [Periconia macrospinosa]